MTFSPPSADEIAKLLAERNARTYSLEDVAAMVGISSRTLTLDCRAGKVEHVKAGRRRRMTMHQIELLTASLRTGSTAVGQPSEPDDMQQAREMSLRAAARSTPRRVA
jgi:hypothetical protein